MWKSDRRALVNHQSVEFWHRLLLKEYLYDIDSVIGSDRRC